MQTHYQTLGHYSTALNDTTLSREVKIKKESL